MHPARTLPLLAALPLLAVAALAPSAEATFALRVEGEDRDVDAPLCAFDGERVTDVPYDGASGGRALFYPGSLCWAEWTVFTPVSTRLTIGSISPGGVGECVQWIVVVDASLAGWTREHCAPAAIQPLPVLLFGLTRQGGDSFLFLPPGLHSVIVIASITEGPGFANAHVDYVEFTA